MYPGAGPMGGMPPTGPGQHGMGPQSPMNSPMQQQRRIDPDQMPSPVSGLMCARSTSYVLHSAVVWLLVVLAVD